MAKTFHEDDNVVPFERPALATAPKEPGTDWLRTLPHGARFLCQRKEYSKNNYHYDLYGIGAWTPNAILLWAFDGRPPEWVNSLRFSMQHNFIEQLPEKPASPDEEAGDTS